MSNQHAREWITPEMTRRLMHYYLDNYGTDKRITKIVDTTELWFVLSANPDGYDYTFTARQPAVAQEPARQQRRRRDHHRRRRRPQPQLRLQVGLRQRGFVPQPDQRDLPRREPRLRARDQGARRLREAHRLRRTASTTTPPPNCCSTASAGRSPPRPRTTSLYKALAGTPDNSAIPGYHPQVSSELYTTNGEADGHAANVNGMAMFTPEMSTCQTASNARPGRRVERRPTAQSVFTFPDDEKLIQAEFAKNIPFALSVAETAAHPDQPSSSVGLNAPDFTPDAFTTSYSRGADQEVSVVARKSVRDKELKYRVNGGRTARRGAQGLEGRRDATAATDNLYFDEYRAKVEDGDPGDKVEVWFTGETEGRQKRTSSEHFTYTVAERPRADMLVVAEEGAAATQAQTYVDALKANGRKAARLGRRHPGRARRARRARPLQDGRPLHRRRAAPATPPSSSCATTSTRAAS